MRKIAGVLLYASFAAGLLFAQELNVSGEMKTGFYMETEKIGNLDSRAKGGMRNNDGDSGTAEGRIRLNFDFSYENMGLRIRFQIDPDGTDAFRPTWNYAYAYGNLFGDQFTVSAGILGNSPWGTGGPELKQELETRIKSTGKNKLSGEVFAETEGLMGIRFEYKPSFLSGLNLGFVLNQPDQTVKKSTKDQTFGELLQESIIGAAYEHEYFAARVGFRFDSDVDKYNSINKDEGGRLTYRLEEKILNTFVDGMQVWLNGYYYGIGAEKFDQMIFVGYDPNDGSELYEPRKVSGGSYSINWLYWVWDNENFLARFNTCLSIYQTYFNTTSIPNLRQKYQSLEFKPAFYYKFLGNTLQAGLGLGFGLEFGPGKTYSKAPYQYISIEPQVRLNIGSNTYLSLLYNFTDSYAYPDNDYEGDKILRGDKSQKHWINLRAVYTF